jgi:hypothetical protein
MFDVGSVAKGVVSLWRWRCVLVQVGGVYCWLWTVQTRGIQRWLLPAVSSCCRVQCSVRRPSMQSTEVAVGSPVTRYDPHSSTSRPPFGQISTGVTTPRYCGGGVSLVLARGGGTRVGMSWSPGGG